LKRRKAEFALPLVSEITDPRQISAMLEVVDVFQVGSRNMYNYELLKELALTKRPVLFKRAFSATLDEWLKAADYLTHGGNDQVMLCERGIRTFETTTRNTLDLNSVAYLKAYSSFPIIVDPSHGTGRRDLVAPLCRAAVALGADGLIIEAHESPANALSDGDQAIPFSDLPDLIASLRPIAQAVGREIATGALL
jgi:3-deoxy-7-phosphoheptulonate synthase